MKMKCPKCRFENPNEAEFCVECGAPIEFHCPKCGVITPATGKFCMKCGHDLTEAKAAPPIDYSHPQSYTPKFLADKILTTRSALEGERKLVTVLFADVANYTSISEKLDPEEVHQIMDGCFKLLMDEIHRYEGTIDKFTGDGVMALFGAPVAHEDHAQRACYAALAIQRTIEEYGEKVEKECGVEFKMRVGLNSGPVIVGSVGNDLRMDYTAIGDTTNLASRMESMARPGSIMVSADTHKMARDFFKFEPLGKVRVKGKKEPVEAYQLIEAGEVETRFEAAVAKGLTKFVGRQREMEALKEAFEKAQSGSGQVVGIVGEAGVGKSRLILELRGMLPREEYTYLQGRCLHYGSSMAYLPFLDILRSYFDIKEGEREFVIKKKMEEKVSQLGEELKGILPPLHEILSLKVEDEEYLKLEPSQKRERTFEAIRDLLIRESENKPLTLAVEDLHWVDRTSEEFLTYLIGWLANARILLILLYRPEYTHQWGSKSYYSQIGMDQLPTRTSAELVQSILEEGEVVPELRELILSRAAGNPLFMEEFTHTLLENGSIEKKDHEYVLIRQASDIQVPDTIQGVIAARMDRLEDNLKRTMQVASVIGRDFAYRILQTITQMREELKSYLINLQGLEFIYEKSLFPELEYIFKHALTQEVAYSSLLLKRRKEIHGKIGKAIEELYPERLAEFYEMLAYHYSRSENWEKAYHYLKLSGDKAVLSYSVWEAFRFGKEAIKVLSQLPETEGNKRRGIEVRLLMCTPMALLGYPEDDSLQILQEGERLSKELGDHRSLAKLYGFMGMYYSVKGQPLLGIQYSENSFREAEKVKDIDLMAPTGFNLCLSYHSRGDCSKVIDMASKVIALLEETQRQSESFGGINLYLILCAFYANAMDMLGDFRGGQKVREKALRFAHEIKDLAALGTAEHIHGMSLVIHKGDGENGVKHLQNAIRYGEEGQLLIILGMAWGGLGWGYYLLGELDTAREHTEKGLKMQSDAGVPILLSIPYCALCMVHFDLCDLKSAQSCAEEALRLSENNNEKWVEGMSRTLLGRVLGKREKSQYAKAEEYILQGIKILDELRIRPNCSIGYLFLGELYADTGQREKALETLKKAEGMFTEMGMDYWLRRTQEVLERVEG
jgi:class 3 adenylate cyclase/tetratricopeptide (TPR) repeat protein